jgi:hypothetical protein
MKTLLLKATLISFPDFLVIGEEFEELVRKDWWGDRRAYKVQRIRDIAR